MQRKKRFGASFEVAVMMFRVREKEKNTIFWGQSPNAAWPVHRRSFSERN
jgi:hypothetical protein